MNSDMRVIVKLIPLWVVFLLSLLLAFWSLQHLAISLIQVGNSNTIAMENYGGMGYGYSNYCLVVPMYPSLSSSMMPGVALTQDDKVALEKYEQEMKVYNEEYSKACKEDLAKKEVENRKFDRFSWLGAGAIYMVMTFFSVLVSVLLFLAIKNTEREFGKN